jgi:hypothetical protein
VGIYGGILNSNEYAVKREGNIAQKIF